METYIDLYRLVFFASLAASKSECHLVAAPIVIAKAGGVMLLLLMQRVIVGIFEEIGGRSKMGVQLKNATVSCCNSPTRISDSVDMCRQCRVQVIPP